MVVLMKALSEAFVQEIRVVPEKVPEGSVKGQTGGGDDL